MKLYEFYVANEMLTSSTHQALLLIQSQSKMSLQSHPIVLPQLMILINISVQMQPIGLVILLPNVSRSPCKSTHQIQVRHDEFKHYACWFSNLFCQNVTMNYTSFLSIYNLFCLNITTMNYISSIYRLLSELVDFNCCRF